jgi:glycolate oxidase iron-sulfur subunit
LKTSFSPAQLQDPQIGEADEILQTCVHYGFCTATCPTYVLTGDENESPRGRIDLMRHMLESGKPPSRETVQHLDTCLSCLSCSTTCAVKVDYGHLIDIGRDYIERHYRRPLGDRVLRRMLAETLPFPRRFRTVLALASLARPLAGALPKRLANLVSMSSTARSRPEIIPPQMFPAEGTRRLRVALLTGCAQQTLDRNINAATIRVLRRHGCDVVVASHSGCCGALPLHMGRSEQARELATANVVAWTKELATDGLDHIVVNASGCGTTVKDYGHLLGTAAAKDVGSLTRDVSEILAKLDLKVSGAVGRYRVAYHDACSLMHGQRVTQQPRAILKKAGFDVVDLSERHFCCGSAGTYNLLQPDMARELGQRKAVNVESVDPQILAAGNLGCMVQIGRYSDVPIAHTVELVDWATGGPKPAALLDRSLANPPAKPPDTAGTAVTPDGAAAGGADNAGVW